MTVRMIDAHCHIDFYPDPVAVAREASSHGVLTIWVTNSPTAFERAIRQAIDLSNIRVALGLHPLEAHRAIGQLHRFGELCHTTSYIGEIGLDFSVHGHNSKNIQLQAFRFILKLLTGKPKFLTLHSRKAESAVIDLLDEYAICPAVFHWFSGSTAQLKRAINGGHFFSINPSMISSQKGKTLVEAIPLERVLTETDGPFSKASFRRAVPGDVELVEKHMGMVWGISREEVSSRIRSNFLRLIGPLGEETNVDRVGRDC